MGEKEIRHLEDSRLDQVSGGNSSPRRQKIGYNVKRGDNLIGIASRFGVSVMDIVSWNDIRNPDLIYEGQTLIIYKS